ncbi:MAG TPA: ATP-binding protein [Solirubrobacteraceae bacterium]|nr:ATP-binding protein [Solirubrobacteraceae bacterium]
MTAGPVVMAWSGGKDAALALHRLRVGGREVRALLTTVEEGAGRVSMHGVPVELVRLQAAALGLPLIEMEAPAWPSNEVYEQRLANALADAQIADVHDVAFGDLFLADIRAYREQRLAKLGRRALFPLFGEDTAALAHEVVETGHRATIVCVDPARLDPSFAGRAYDEGLLRELPDGVDPCAENGEFHTFVHDGPGFARQVPFTLGAAVERDGFVYRAPALTGAGAGRTVAP